MVSSWFYKQCVAEDDAQKPYYLLGSFYDLRGDIIQKEISMLKKCESDTSQLDQAKDPSQVLQNTDIKFCVSLQAGNYLIRGRLTGFR